MSANDNTSVFDVNAEIELILTALRLVADTTQNKSENCILATAYNRLARVQRHLDAQQKIHLVRP